MGRAPGVSECSRKGLNHADGELFLSSRSSEVLGAAEAMWIILVLALCGLAAAVPSEDRKLSDKATTLADRSTTLAFNLYHAMAKDKTMENILLSPVVVASSLGLVSLGGKATTASQAKAVLSADKLNDDYMHSGLSELLNEVSNSTARNVTWKIGNRLYGPASINFADDFVKNSKKHYNYEHSKINFRDKRSALKSINEWAAQTTDGKLPEVTKDVEKTDGALIVNAMFFKRKFYLQFLIQVTQNLPSANTQQPKWEGEQILGPLEACSFSEQVVKNCA